MLHFRQHQWLRRNGASLFTALIGPEDRRREDVFWCLALEWFATGARWRRVPWTERPSLSLLFSSIRAPARSWTGLEDLNFWSLPERDADYMDLYHWRRRGAGYLDVRYRPRQGTDTLENTCLSGGHFWRVVSREGRWFTLEIGLLADGTDIYEELDALPIHVTPAGEEEQAEPDGEFWRKQATIYAIEEVPFGTVTVRVPRNARDVEAYALSRARELIGVPEPEHLEVRDHARFKSAKARRPGSEIDRDIYVELHFGSEYES